MAKIRSKNTKPEIKLRSLLHRLGYRFRVHDGTLPGRPDLVFTRRHKVIFVHGCFWHGHSCKVGVRLPKTNTEFWDLKRKTNQDRDARQAQELFALGWDVLVVWECELTQGAPDIRDILAFLGAPKTPPPTGM